MSKHSRSKRQRRAGAPAHKVRAGIVQGIDAQRIVNHLMRSGQPVHLVGADGQVEDVEWWGRPF